MKWWLIYAACASVLVWSIAQAVWKSPDPREILERINRGE